MSKDLTQSIEDFAYKRLIQMGFESPIVQEASLHDLTGSGLGSDHQYRLHARFLTKDNEVRFLKLDYASEKSFKEALNNEQTN